MGDSVSSYCRQHGADRGPVQCRKRWSNMISDFNKIKTWESQANGSSESYWIISNDLWREKRLSETVEEEAEEEEEENDDVSHTGEYTMEDDVLPPATEEVGSNPLKEGDVKYNKAKSIPSPTPISGNLCIRGRILFKKGRVILA
ncbi:hypothetical protein CQW23_20191 [Capsicum baccatum]|uniref:Myb/SANT-like DNA-binding domain-containing protein n=1 Tax=Capsicum baccatum TaxID=33114 RepID=A0A2G2W801_CAPBA|nr:hypothetical protein CQW23_20191 [Capsicum baccatum]